jgi:hypothetical protein
LLLHQAHRQKANYWDMAKTNLRLGISTPGFENQTLKMRAKIWGARPQMILHQIQSITKLIALSNCPPGIILGVFTMLNAMERPMAASLY